MGLKEIRTLMQADGFGLQIKLTFLNKIVNSFSGPRLEQIS
jgi:hypothetical protein